MTQRKHKFYIKSRDRAMFIKSKFELHGVNMDDFYRACPYPINLLVSSSREMDLVSWRSCGMILAFCIYVNQNKAAKIFNKDRSTIYHSFKKLDIELEDEKFGNEISDCLRSVNWYMKNRSESKRGLFCDTTNIISLQPTKALISDSWDKRESKTVFNR